MNNGSRADRDISAVDPVRFREVLGHYPTGVVVVSAFLADDQPVGMVVGSFTSVSLDPPLVAFLPDRGSSTYQLLRECDRFTINVLSAAQENVCRQLSSKDVAARWTGIEWRTGQYGPLLDGGVAWIDCEKVEVITSGDHDIVIAAVHDLDAPHPMLPLLFFQGGYGRFAPASLVVSSQAGLSWPIRMAESARSHMEEFAGRMDRECVAHALVDDEVLVVATAGTPGGRAPLNVLGRRVPHVPPAGNLFVAWADETGFEHWLARLPGPIQEANRDLLATQLRKTRDRGFSIALQSPRLPEVHAVVDSFTRGTYTPSQERELIQLMTALNSYYEPEELDTSDLHVRSVSVPVFDRSGAVVLTLSLRDLGPGRTAEEIEGIAERLKVLARNVGDAIAGGAD